MTDECISRLRQRMIEDMTVRNFVAKTQTDYIRRIRNFAIKRDLVEPTAGSAMPAFSRLRPIFVLHNNFVMWQETTWRHLALIR